MRLLKRVLRSLPLLLVSPFVVVASALALALVDILWWLRARGRAAGLA